MDGSVTLASEKGLSNDKDVLISRLGLSALVSSAFVSILAVPKVCVAVDCEWISQALLPRDGTVPASLESIAWSMRLSPEHAAKVKSYVRFSKTDAAGNTSDVDFRVENQDYPRLQGSKLIPAQPLLPGYRYRIVADPMSGENLDPEKDFDRSEFLVTKAAPLPTSNHLGTLQLDGGVQHKEISFISGGWFRIDAAFQDLKIDLDEAFKPWASALIYETLVDGKPWSEPRNDCGTRLGWSWHGHGVDRVFASCAGPETDEYLNAGVKRGSHTARLRARLAGSDTVFYSSAVNFNLDCDGLEESGGTGTEDDTSSAQSSSSSGGAGTSSDEITTSSVNDSTGSSGGSGTPSAAPGGAGGDSSGTDSSAALPGAAGNPGAPAGSNDGCRMASGGDLGSWMWGALLLVGGCWRRRKLS